MSDIDRGHYDMTPETKAYLDQQFEHLEKRILDITSPIKEGVEKLRADIAEIYGRLGKAETKIAILEDNKGSRQNNVPIIISIVFGVVMAALAVIVLIV
jgi:hypothetical protein